MANDHLYNWLASGFSVKPEKVAVKEFNGSSITYNEIEKETCRFSIAIKKRTGKIAEPVAVYGKKSIGAVIAILAVLRSGNAYVPLDPESPKGRIATILEQSDIKIVLAERELMYGNSIFVEIEDLCNGWSLYCHLDQSIQHKLPIDAAYVLFTSGSTGNPKGVVISHKAAIAFLNWSVNTFQPGPNDVFSSIAPFHFDLSVFDLFVSLHSASTLVLLNSDHLRQPEYLSIAIQNEKISYWYSTPTVLQLMMEFGHTEDYDFSSLRHCLFAGEAFPPASFRNLQKRIPFCVFSNLYGPTETNVCTFYTVQDNNWNERFPLPIGTTTSQYRHAINSDGVLLISGASLMTGYYGQESLTHEVFRYVEGQKWYYTGDLVLEQNGLLFFQGRIDRMVKRRGYRIELDEIEIAMRAIRGVSGVATVEIAQKGAASEIVAFYTGKAEQKLIREQLLLSLPLYMLPDKFINLEELPRTTTHKTDYTALKIKYAERNS